jgi:hypothetical protein
MRLRIPPRDVPLPVVDSPRDTPPDAPSITMEIVSGEDEAPASDEEMHEAIVFLRFRELVTEKMADAMLRALRSC